MDAEGQLTNDWIADALPQQLVEEMPEVHHWKKPRTLTDEEYELNIIIDAVFDDDDDDDVGDD